MKHLDPPPFAGLHGWEAGTMREREQYLAAKWQEMNAEFSRWPVWAKGRYQHHLTRVLRNGDQDAQEVAEFLAFDMTLEDLRKRGLRPATCGLVPIGEVVNSMRQAGRIPA